MIPKGSVKAGLVTSEGFRHPDLVRMFIRVVSPAVSVTVWHRLPANASGKFVFPVNLNTTICKVFTSDKSKEIVSINQATEMLFFPIADPPPSEIIITYTMPLASADRFRVWLPYGLPSQPVSLHVWLQAPVAYIACIKGTLAKRHRLIKRLQSTSNLMLDVYATTNTPLQAIGFLGLQGVSVRLIDMVPGCNFINMVPTPVRGNSDWTIHACPHKWHVRLTFTRLPLYAEADFRDSQVLRSYAGYVLTRNRDMVSLGRRICASLQTLSLFAATVRAPVHGRVGSDEYRCLVPHYPSDSDVDPRNETVVLSCVKNILDDDLIEFLDPPMCLLQPRLVDSSQY
jgi:hypothetical protein